MEFLKKIRELENYNSDSDYVIKMGTVPILFTAVHTMKQIRKDKSIKNNEPYTKAISLFLNEKCKTFSMIKIKDTGLDSNRDNHDEFKMQMLKLVKENEIKLVIDLHGASVNREFDVELGTLNYLTVDFSTIKELEEAFIENGILNVSNNTIFKGGAITQYLFNLKEVDAIQLEINRKYRNLKDVDKLEQLCQCLINFINQYVEKVRL